MPTIPQTNILAKMPVSDLRMSLREFVQPVTALLPDPRLRVVAQLIVQGIVASESPIVTRIARGAGHTDETIWPASKRSYRFLANERLTHRTLRIRVGITRRTVCRLHRAHLVARDSSLAARAGRETRIEE
jgi:hypothetical protein